MYRCLVIEPEWDESFRWSDPPRLPSRIVGGLGWIDENGCAVEVFHGDSEEECWRAAFGASVHSDLPAFRDALHEVGCTPHPWLAVCPGRMTPARWYMMVVPRQLLLEE